MAGRKTGHQQQWQDRYVETITVRAGDVEPHPLNPKIHGESQLAPLRGLLSTVGKLDSLKAYRSEQAGGKLVYWDGHGRMSINPSEEWRVDVYDLTDAEAAVVIASFDPIAYQAQMSRQRLDQLLREVETGDAALQQMLTDLSKSKGLYLEAYDVMMDSPSPRAGNDNDQDEPKPSPPPQQAYPLAIVVNRKTLEKWKVYKDDAGFISDTEAFEHLLSEIEPQ